MVGITNIPLLLGLTRRRTYTEKTHTKRIYTQNGDIHREERGDTYGKEIFIRENIMESGHRIERGEGTYTSKGIIIRNEDIYGEERRESHREVTHWERTYRKGTHRKGKHKKGTHKEGKHP